jgi:hypothetical protein
MTTDNRAAGQRGKRLTTKISAARGQSNYNFLNRRRHALQSADQVQGPYMKVTKARGWIDGDLTG